MLSSPCISYPFFFVTQESISGIGRNVNRTGLWHMYTKFWVIKL